MNELYPVYTLKNECLDCYKCVRSCFVKAIRVQSGSASVVSDKCISCGYCVQACPVSAKKVRDDIEKAKKLILDGKKVFVSLAPSWNGFYDFSMNKIVAILKNLGFHAVSETALGAQEVSIKIASILNEAKKGLFISSACPVIVDYIRYYRPEFVDNITKIASPALTHAKMLKEKYGDEIAVVFIGPCIAKKTESDKHQDLINVALTFDELDLWINSTILDINKIDVDNNDTFVPYSSHEGALYALEGGMNETLKRCGIKDDTIVHHISSLQMFERALIGLDKNKLEKKIFIEALACFNGCISGPGVSSKKSGIDVVSSIVSNVNYRDSIPSDPLVIFEKEYTDKKIEKDKYSSAEINEAMKRIGKYSQIEEINCGGCGYKTCKDLANALLSGDAEPAMCVSYMRKQAFKKAAAMIRCMPSGIVMVDKDLVILETNDAFIRMFCEDADFLIQIHTGLSGAFLDKVVPIGEIFKLTLNSGDDIRKEHYRIKDKMYNITAFTIEAGEIAGAIVTDITQTEIDREKIAKRAKEVISKNISTVQNIASLLGEHMAETELLLSSIAQDFDNGINED